MHKPRLRAKISHGCEVGLHDCGEIAPLIFVGELAVRESGTRVKSKPENLVDLNIPAIIVRVKAGGLCVSNAIAKFSEWISRLT